MTITTGDPKAGHRPEQRVKGARLLGEEVPCRVMGSGCLWDFALRAGLDGVNQVGKADGILTVWLLAIRGGDSEIKASGSEARLSL